MSMFKGFTKEQLIATKPKILIDVLSQQLALTNKALEAVSEELKQLRTEVGKIRESVDYIAKKTDSPTIAEKEMERAELSKGFI